MGIINRLQLLNNSEPKKKTLTKLITMALLKRCNTTQKPTHCCTRFAYGPTAHGQYSTALKIYNECKWNRVL